jgi:polysaccharide transporter, PST family
MNDKSKLSSNLISLTSIQALNYLLPLLTIPYLILVLDMELFGLLAFSQAFITIFNVVVEYGFRLSATREIAHNINDKEKINEIYSSVIIIKFALVAVSFFVLNLIIFSFEIFTSNWNLHVITFLSVIGNAMFPVWYFQGIEKMKFIAIINAIARLIFVILIFVIIQEKSDYIYVPLLNGIGLIIAGVLSNIIIYKKFNQKFYMQSIDILKKHLKYSTHFFISRLSVMTYTSTAVLILGFYTNTTMVGYYALSEKLYQALQGLYHPIIHVMYPHLLKTQDLRLYKKIFYSVIMFHGVIFLLLYSFTGDIIYLIFDKSNLEIFKLFKLFLLSSLLYIPAILMGYPFLAAFGYPEYANNSLIYASLLHIFNIFLLILFDNVNIYNVAYVVMLTEASVLMIRVYYTKKSKIISKYKII